MATASCAMSAAAHSETEIEATQLATKNIKITTSEKPPAKPTHDEETTDGGSNVSDSEGSTISGTTAMRPAAPIGSKASEPEAPSEPAQKAAAPVKPQGGKSRGGKSKGGRNQQQVSSLRSALRSKGNTVIAQVATCHPSVLTNSVGRPAATPVPQSSGPLATGCSITAAPSAPGIGAAMPCYPLHAQVAAPMPRPNSVAVPCRRPPAVPTAMPVPSPPGLAPAGASARGLYGNAIDGGYYHGSMAYGLDFAFEQGRAYQREAAVRAMAAADGAAAVSYAAAAVGAQQLPMYARANELPPAFDPKLPVKKRVSSFLAEASTSTGLTRPWGAEPAHC